MARNLKQIREGCAKAREAMARSRQEHFAIGAFNIDNQETLIAVAKAAQKLQAPVMVEVSDTEVKAMGFDNILDMVDNYKRDFDIEMYINMDHCPTVEMAKEAIDTGYEFVHIDVSQAQHDAPDSEIIEATKQIVEYAKTTGAQVEGELHYFRGGSNVFKEAFNYEEIKKTFSTPEEAKMFVTATGIDTYAAAIGNLHGYYPVPKILDLDLLEQIRKVIDCNISLHGGSDTPAHYFEGAVHIGVSKVNVNSDLRKAFRETLEKVLRENPDEYAIVKLMPEVYGAVRAVVESKIQWFNAVGKAKP